MKKIGNPIFWYISIFVFTARKLSQSKDFLCFPNVQIWVFKIKNIDNFKDEKISDFKTVSVSQSKNLLDWKLVV